VVFDEKHATESLRRYYAEFILKTISFILSLWHEITEIAQLCLKGQAVQVFSGLRPTQQYLVLATPEPPQPVQYCTACMGFVYFCAPDETFLVTQIDLK
jgi:hypothetical protein